MRNRKDLPRISYVPAIWRYVANDRTINNHTRWLMAREVICIEMLRAVEWYRTPEMTLFLLLIVAVSYMIEI
jgi:hypothetical protein